MVGERVHAGVGHVPETGGCIGRRLGGFAGAVGGMLIAKLTGYLLEVTGTT